MAEVICFQCSWVENAVRACLKKASGDITAEDLQQIKYLRIGESFENDFFIELSAENPPDPFVDTDGGDEWGEACLFSGQIEPFLEEQTEPSFPLFIDSKLETWAYAYERDAKVRWQQYKSSIMKENYYVKYEDDDEFDAWYEKTVLDFPKDIPLFTNLEVLRVYGGHLPSFQLLAPLSHLRAVEFAETSFETYEGKGVLSKLQQLCCWMD